MSFEQIRKQIIFASGILLSKYVCSLLDMLFILSCIYFVITIISFFGYLGLCSRIELRLREREHLQLDKVFKNGASTICVRQPLKNLKGYVSLSLT